MQVLKGCLAAKNRFKSKMSKTKYSMSFSKMAAVTREEVMTASKRAEDSVKAVANSTKVKKILRFATLPSRQLRTAPR